MTKQQTFNYVIRHLRKQRIQSVIKLGDCRYRGPNGRKCAIGCLIPDNVYDASIEGNTVKASGMYEFLEMLGHDVGLCNDLQILHDSYMVDGWDEKSEFVAECIAEKHELEMCV